MLAAAFFAMFVRMSADLGREAIALQSLPDPKVIAFYANLGGVRGQPKDWDAPKDFRGDRLELLLRWPMASPKKKMTREQAWAWAQQHANPDLPSVLACAIPPGASTDESAARIALGSLSPSRVGPVAQRLPRLVRALEADAAEESAAATRASSGTPFFDVGTAEWCSDRLSETATGPEEDC